MRPYRQNDRYFVAYGDVWWGQPGSIGSSHVADGNTLMAVFVDFGDPTDPEALATLHFHGRYELVAARADRTRASISALKPQTAATLEVIAFPIHADIIEELNACIDCSGRIGKFKAFLTNFALTHPEFRHPAFAA